MNQQPPAPQGPSFQFQRPAAFSKPATGPKQLVLTRRASPLAIAKESLANVSSETGEVRRSLDALVAQSRSPWGTTVGLSGSQLEELQKTIRTLEAKVAERELAAEEARSRLAERERELAETEALLAARTRVNEAAKATTGHGTVSPEQMEALKALKTAIDQQEAALKEQQLAMREREAFLEQSETALFAKFQHQQEKETELEQLEEDLHRRARQLGLEPPESLEPIEKA